MNLRQQFFWKLLIGLSAFTILIYLYNSYSKYSELAEYKKEYKRESEVKDNKKLERKTDFISSKQNDRIKYNPDLVSIVEKLSQVILGQELKQIQKQTGNLMIQFLEALQIIGR